MNVSELFEQYTQAVNIFVDDVNELFPPDHILRFKSEILKCFHCNHIRQYNNKSYIQGILFTKSFHMYDLIDRTWRSAHGDRGKGWKGECSATQSVAQRLQSRDYLDTLVKGPTTGPNYSQKGSRIQGLCLTNQPFKIIVTDGPNLCSSLTITDIVKQVNKLHNRFQNKKTMSKSLNLFDLVVSPSQECLRII